MLALEDTWDLRYPLCTGSECPDGCEAGTTAELLLDCYMAIDMRKVIILYIIMAHNLSSLTEGHN